MSEVVRKVRDVLAKVSTEEREAIIDALNESVGARAHPLIDGNAWIQALIGWALATLPADTEEAFQVLAQVDDLPLVGAAPAVNPARQVDR